MHAYDMILTELACAAAATKDFFCFDENYFMHEALLGVVGESIFQPEFGVLYWRRV